MKILLIGDFYWQMYAKAFYNAFNAKGYEIKAFDTSAYFKNRPNLIGLRKKKKDLLDYWYVSQSILDTGPIIYKINFDLKKIIDNEMPDLVFIYRDRHIRPYTINWIKHKGIKVFTYNNDDPFSLEYPKYYWRNYIKVSKICDHVFVFRKSNIEQYMKIGVINTSLLRAYFIKERNYYIDRCALSKRYKCDVIFIGHFEDDKRDDYIKKLYDKGYDVKLYGSGWHKSMYYEFFLSKMEVIKNLDKDYNIAINSAKIALVFLSKRHKDTYTRRCFEIPVAKTFMLSEYTDDLNSMFQEGKEAEYFRNEKELFKKIDYYLKHEEEREEIAHNGYKRLMKDGHEVENRINIIIEKFYELS